MNVCRICSSAQRDSIDQEICDGGTIALIARKYGVRYEALLNHSKRHVGINSVSPVYNLESDISLWRRRMETAYQVAVRSKRPTTEVLALSREMSKYLEVVQNKQLQTARERIRELESELLSRNDKTDITSEHNNYKIFTEPELNMISKLSEKLEKQDKSIIIIPEGYNYSDIVNLQPVVKIVEKEQEEIPMQRTKRNKVSIEESKPGPQLYSPQPGVKCSWINGIAVPPPPGKLR